jgi:hypothetical protein
LEHPISHSELILLSCKDLSSFFIDILLTE